MFTTEQFSITAIIVLGLQKLNPYTNLITDLFIILCVFLLIFAIYKRGVFFANFAPTLLTSLGLLGIFLGTAIGLSVFDGQQIENSISRLMGGLGMAFITGAAGIFSALLIKLINRKKAKPEKSPNITPTDIYRVLTEISEHSANQKAILSNMAEKANAHQQHLQKVLKLQQVGFAQEVRLLEDLKHSLTGENENSLATQIQNLRFSTEKTVEDSNQYLVQVIESPMKYFTNTIGEQFGENFKQLNQAVAALVRWQDDYREQMVKMHEQFTSSVDDVNKSRTALEEMATHIQGMKQTMQQLVQVIQGLHQQLEDTGLHLEGFQAVGQQAGKVFPMIETNLNELSQGMRQQVQRHLELLDTSLETQLDLAEASLEIQLDGFKGLQNRVIELESQVSGTAKAPTIEAPPIETTFDKIPTVEVPPVETTNDKAAPVPEELPEDSEDAELLQTATTTTMPYDSGDKNPDDYDALQSRAFAFMELGRYQKAITYFDQVIEINPEQFSLFYNKACCCALLEQVDLAIVALQEAIYLNSECLEMAKTDSDFDKIRYDTRFRSLLRGY
jgi:tetratricopeptide (TPR) repeat protein